MTHRQDGRDLVLVVDDETVQRLVLRGALHEAGFEVVEAEDGEAAVEKFDELSPDLVLMDVEMPRRDGYSACEAMRSREAGQQIPIVVVTGLEDAQSVNRAYDAGATDFISKPINLTVLGNRVRHILRASRTYQVLQATENKNQALLEAIPDTLVVVDRNAAVLDDLPERRTAIGPPHIIGKTLVDFLAVSDATAVLDCIRQTLETGAEHSHEYELRSGRGKRSFETRIIRYGADRALALVRDVTERRRVQQKIHDLAYYDTLTGLPNRQLFLKELHNTIRWAGPNGQRLAVLYIDLDNFKRINDTLGHTIGDALLKAAAKRLERCLRIDASSTQIGVARAGPALARLGGDEFIVLCDDTSCDDEVTELAGRIREALSAPVQHDGHEFVITPSIGIAQYPRDGEDVESLLMNADTAMYDAKSCGRNTHRFYARAMSARSRERLQMEAELRRGIEQEEFELHYQPQVDAHSWQIIGAEALLRWRHPERGLVPPLDFIALAEETGLIVPISDWVLREACSQATAWHERGLGAIRVAVNLSSQQFYRGNLVASVSQALLEAALDPELLELELTETILMRDTPETVGALTRLKDMGVKLAVDDFGTGYCSLNYLQKFPLDALKIDRSFITDSTDASGDQAISAAILALGHSLGLRVIAEGVETEAQLEFLRRRSCDEIQGFLYSKPLPSAEFEALFLSKAAEPTAKSAS